MAYTYSNTIRAGKTTNNPDFGNTPLTVQIFRGECTRTATTVSFNFGVSFTRVNQEDNGGTAHSIAARYNNTKYYAKVNSLGQSNGNTWIKKGTTVYASSTLTYTANTNTQNTTKGLVYTYTNNNIKSTDTSVNVTIGAGWYNYSGDIKGDLTFTLDIPIYYTLGTVPTPTITDNGDHTCTISGFTGSDGTNNKVSSSALYYSSNGADPTYKWTELNETRRVVLPNAADTPFTTTIDKNISDNYNNFNRWTKTTFNAGGKTIKALVSSAYPYGPKETIGGANYTLVKSAVASLTIKKYEKPTFETTARLTVAPSSGSRLTLKRDWKFDWSAATAGNANSPVKGYTLAIWRKRGSGDWTRVANFSNITKTEYAVDPSILNVQVGDKIKAGVQAYSENGIGQKTWSINSTQISLYSSTISTSEVEIQNAGIVHVKVGDDWREGQVYVKVGDAWREAESVHVNVNGTWRESV